MRRVLPGILKGLSNMSYSVIFIAFPTALNLICLHNSPNLTFRVTFEPFERDLFIFNSKKIC